MAKWLDKYEQGGMVLKQKTKDNYGVKPNVNDDKATYPDGFVGWEYDITGRNYSPAWGGQFKDGGNLMPAMAGANQTIPMYQMGGSLPGAVGFMYARTQNPAPSNGPYAKKTKASAQNGQEMKYYQEGLDFKPKTISQDGSKLKTIPRATGDIASYFPKIDVKKEMLAAVSDEQKKAFLRNEQAKKAIEKQGEIRPAKDQSTGSKIWEVLTNPVEYLGYKVRGQRVPEHFSRGETKSTGLNTVVNMVNPFEVVDSGIDFVSDLGDIGENVAKGNLRAAGKGVVPAMAHALGALPMVVGTGVTAEVLWPGIKSAKNAFKATSDLPMGKRVVNAINTGALKARIDGDVTGHAYFNMTPEAVQKAMSEEVANLPKNALSYDKNMSINSAPLYWNQAARMKNQGFTIVRPGVDQSLNTMGNQGRRVAEAIPNDVKSLYPDIVEEHANRVAYLRSLGDEAGANMVEKRGITPNLLMSLQSEAASSVDPLRKEYYNQFLQNYKPTLDRSIENVNRATGLNFPMSNIENLGYKMPMILAVKGNPLGRIPKSIGKELSQLNRLQTVIPGSAAINQEGDYAKRKGFKEGGVVVDPEGYWNPENWGNPVIIPSTDITMEGVLEPLIGISDTGDTQYMEPGEDYQFDGEYVTEYPVAKGGISVNNADAQPVKKLDQLLNFTNYNKPTNGGWLDKYN
jgi:hypothetical protein